MLFLTVNLINQSLVFQARDTQTEHYPNQKILIKRLMHFTHMLISWQFQIVSSGCLENVYVYTRTCNTSPTPMVLHISAHDIIARL